MPMEALVRVGGVFQRISKSSPVSSATRPSFCGHVAEKSDRAPGTGELPGSLAGNP